MRLIKALLPLLAYRRYWPNRLFGFIHQWRGARIQNLRNTVIACCHGLTEQIYPVLARIAPKAWLTQHRKVFAYYRPTDRIIGPDRVRPVEIDACDFIGVGDIILPSVAVGECAVVGAGAVVNKDVPPLAVVAGNPPGFIRHNKDIPVHDLRDARMEGGQVCRPEF